VDWNEFQKELIKKHWDENKMEVVVENKEQAEKLGLRYDEGKPRMDLIPPEVYTALGSVLEFGAKKYEDRNWEKGMKWGKVVGSLLRHLTKWLMGQSFDEESKLPHTWHILTNAAFLVTYEERDIGEDDRE
jgi:hypothetical protein